MDKYSAIRSVTFPVFAAALGVDVNRFKTRKGGTEWYGPCPLHDAKKNQTSFSINADGKYQCFSCGAKGRGALDFTMQLRGVGFKAAVELLEPLVGVQTGQISLAKEKEPIEAPGELQPYRGTYEKFQVPCPWLEARIPDAAVRERYGVFCYSNPSRRSAWSGRVMLPIRDVDGVLYGYLGRYCGNTLNPDNSTPKYLFPKNLPKSRFLFGAHELRQAHGPELLRIVYLVESPFSVMKFASLGLPAVSPFGWSVSEEQIRLLLGLTRGLIYIPDSNKRQESLGVAGLLSQRLWTRCPELPPQIEDPEHLSLEQVVALTR